MEKSGGFSWGRALPVEKIFFYFWIVLKIASKNLLWLSDEIDGGQPGYAETGPYVASSGSHLLRSTLFSG